MSHSTQEMPGESYQVVKLANGAFSVRSLSHGETFHPVIGPVAEAEALYVRQLGLVDRIRTTREEFVIWDVGLGAAANPVTLLRNLAGVERRIRIVSFDCTKMPLAFALENTSALGYLAGFEAPLAALIESNHSAFQMPGGPSVEWELHVTDFPSFLERGEAAALPGPHAIFYDAFSPAKNAPMWTLPVFTNLRRLLDPNRPCLMPTYSRSTLLRVTILLAGFYVGVGHATGEKEETTIAANALELLDEPLGRDWLERARRSRSAEPLHEGTYRQHPLRPETWAQLCAHPQFRDDTERMGSSEGHGVEA